jgi:hypothetical protein
MLQATIVPYRENKHQTFRHRWKGSLLSYSMHEAAQVIEKQRRNTYHDHQRSSSNHSNN